MQDTWSTHYHGTISGRSVTVQTYSEGGYRIITTKAEDDEIEPNVESPEDGIFPVPPMKKGDKVVLEEEDIPTMRQALKQEGFSDQDIEKIISYFPAQGRC